MSTPISLCPTQSTSPGDRPQRQRRLLTLQPNRIIETGQEAYDISGMTYARFSTPTASTKPVLTRLRYHSRYHENIQSMLRFPPNTKGYLYYHLEKGMPPISGELRLRICDAPSDFDRGYDLFNSDGFGPWSVPLYKLVHWNAYAGIYHLLSQEGLVDADLLSDVQRLPLHKSSTFLYDIEQPFVADLSHHINSFTLLKRNALVRFAIQVIFGKQRVPALTKVYPYAGELP